MYSTRSLLAGRTRAGFEYLAAGASLVVGSDAGGALRMEAEEEEREEEALTDGRGGG
jgi:hypothetical protein